MPFLILQYAKYMFVKCHSYIIINHVHVSHMPLQWMFIPSILLAYAIPDFVKCQWYFAHVQVSKSKAASEWQHKLFHSSTWMKVWNLNVLTSCFKNEHNQWFIGLYCKHIIPAIVHCYTTTYDKYTPRIFLVYACHIHFLGEKWFLLANAVSPALVIICTCQFWVMKEVSSFLWQ
jgi:hypothetical protein